MPQPSSSSSAPVKMSSVSRSAGVGELNLPGPDSTLEGFDDGQWRFSGPGDLTAAIGRSLDAGAANLGGEAFANNPLAARVATPFVLKQNPQLKDNPDLQKGDFATWSLKDVCGYLAKNMDDFKNFAQQTAIEPNDELSRTTGNIRTRGRDLPPF